MTQWEMEELQQLQCYICGGDLGDDPHIDHFIPLSKGGHHGNCNMPLAHSTCNLAKSNKQTWEVEIRYLPPWLNPRCSFGKDRV